MNLQNRFPWHVEQTQLYTFGTQLWVNGVGAHSFERDLTASDGNAPEEVTRCIRVIEQLQSDRVKQGKLGVHSGRLHRRILDEDAVQLIPPPESGMTAASLRFVIRLLTGTLDMQSNGQGQSSRFLLWLAQICITLWTYDCSRNTLVDLEKYAHDFVSAANFRPAENDVAYLTIIAFVLGGRLRSKLQEYVDAVVWHSRAELASAISPLRRAIIRERQALLEVIFSRFSQILTGLAYSHDVQMKALGETLLESFQKFTDPLMDFGKPFAHCQHLDCASYPQKLEAGLFDALIAEHTRLTARAPSIASNLSDSSGKTAKQEKSMRHGSGGATFGAMKRALTGTKQDPLPPSESPADRLDAIIRQSREIINQRRRMIAIAVNELLEDRDDRYDRSLSAGDESDRDTGSGSTEGSST